MITVKKLSVISPKKSPKFRKNHDFHSDYVPNLIETRHEELVNEARLTRKQLRQEAIMLRKAALWTMIISAISMALLDCFSSYAREALGALCMIALGTACVLYVPGTMIISSVTTTAPNTSEDDAKRLPKADQNTMYNPNAPPFFQNNGGTQAPANSGGNNFTQPQQGATIIPGVVVNPQTPDNQGNQRFNGSYNN